MYILVLNQHHIKLAVLKAACIHSHIGVLSKGSFLYQSFLQLLNFFFLSTLNMHIQQLTNDFNTVLFLIPFP